MCSTKHPFQICLALERQPRRLGSHHAQLGDSDKVYRWLRTAADTGFPCLPFFDRDPLLSSFRRRSDFTDLLEHVQTRRDSVLMTGIP